MEYRDFGNNGFKVSLLGLGGAHIGSHEVSPADAERTLLEALDLGITLIDTARGYGDSEEKIGRALAGRRQEVILSSKCGYGIEGVADWTPECITRGVEEALGRLRTDVIDIMHLHSCPLDTLQHSGVVEALVAAREAGKIRVAAYAGEEEARSWAIRSGAFGSVETSVNACDQRVLAEELPLMAERGLGVIAKRPIANVFWLYQEQPHGEYCEAYWLRARAMGLQPPDGMDWLEFMIRFSAHQPGVSSIIAGTKNLDHLRRNAELAEMGPLPGDVVEEVKRRFREKDDGWTGQV